MNEDVKDRVERNVALVEHIVTRMAANFPEHICRDDLVQAGMVALIETAGRYDADRGVNFSTFAGRRIEGAVLDVIRHEDWVPRSVRARQREIAAVERELVEQHHESPSDRAVAEAADMTVDELSALRNKIRQGSIMALDRPVRHDDGASTLGDLIVDEEAPDPIESLEKSELQDYIRSAIHLLPERHRLVIIGYFLEGRQMDELAALIGVTQSRISQIKSDALERIRNGVDAQYVDDDETPAPPTRRRDASRRRYAEAIAERSRNPDGVVTV